MSTWHDRHVTCPTCRAVIEVRVASGLHITRLPEIRDQIVNGELHRFTCSSCATRVEVQLPLVYTDFTRGVWIEVRRPSEMAAWQSLAPASAEMFRFAVERGAPILRKRTRVFSTRLVFGYAELREKVVLGDAEIDDIAIECLKLSAIRSDPSGFMPDTRLLVREVDGDSFAIDREPDGARFELRASRDELAQIRAAVEPAIRPPFTDPFVSLNRAIGRFAAQWDAGM